MEKRNRLLGQAPFEFVDVLYYKCKCEIFFFARSVQNEVSQRKEGEKRHIVCYQHRADKGYINERKDTDLCSLEALNYLSRKQIEEIDILKRTNYSQNAEKAGQRFEIKICDVLGVGRYDERGDHRCAKRNKHDRVFLDKRHNIYSMMSMVMSRGLYVA